MWIEERIRSSFHCSNSAGGGLKLRRCKPDTPAIQIHDENKLSHQHAVHSEGNNTHGGRPVMRNGCGEETKRERNKTAKVVFNYLRFLGRMCLDGTASRIGEDVEGSGQGTI